MSRTLHSNPTTAGSDQCTNARIWLENRHFSPPLETLGVPSRRQSKLSMSLQQNEIGPGACPSSLPGNLVARRPESAISKAAYCSESEPEIPYPFRVRNHVGCTMEKEVRRLKKINLAAAVAEGESIAEWARQNGVPVRTAQCWAQDRNVRREVDACRRRALNQAVGRLTGMAMNAVDGIAHLAKEADSESVQLRAWRGVLADLILHPGNGLLVFRVGHPASSRSRLRRAIACSGLRLERST